MSTIEHRHEPHADGRLPSLRMLVRLMANQPVRYPVSLVLWTGIWSSGLVVAVIVERFFDGIEAGGPAGWTVTVAVGGLLLWIVVRVASILFGMRWHARVLFRAGAAMQRNMLRWIFGLPGARPVREAPGEVVSRFRDDVDHTLEAMDLSVDFSGAIVSATVAFVLLVAVDPVLAGVAFAPMVVVLVVVWVLSARIRAYRECARAATEAVTGFLGESFSAAQSIKVAGAEDAVLARFDVLNERRRAMMVRDRTLTAATDTMGESTGTIGTGLVLVLAAGTIGATGGLSVGEFALFATLMGQTSFAAFFIGTFLARIRQAGVSFERMVDLMDGGQWQDLTRHNVLESPLSAATRTRPAPGHADAPLVSVRGLSHVHPDGEGGVRDVDLDVNEGQLVVVTGRIGSGKSTLLQTLLGLLPADRGRLEWRGVEVTDPGAFMVPPIAAYTPQVPRLFSMALRDNLEMGESYGDRALWTAIEAATLRADLDTMPAGLETLVGPRGMRLSGGQVQRSAAARMLVRRPDLLVFDDLSSALDVETEALLWEQLFDGSEPATALVVSHRRPALSRADLVVVLDHGVVVDRGTAQELRDRSEAFRDLWG